MGYDLDRFVYAVPDDRGMMIIEKGGLAAFFYA